MTQGPAGPELNPALATHELYQELSGGVEAHRLAFRTLTLGSMNRMAKRLEKTPTDRLEHFLFAMGLPLGESSEFAELKDRCEAFETQFGEDCLERVFGRLEDYGTPDLGNQVSVHRVRPGLYRDYRAAAANLEASYYLPDDFTAVRYQVIVHKDTVVGNVFVPTVGVRLSHGTMSNPEPSGHLLYTITRPHNAFQRPDDGKKRREYEFPDTLFDSDLANVGGPQTYHLGDSAWRVTQLDAARDALFAYL